MLPNHALPTPVQIEKLRPLLCGYDSVLTSILYSGFKFGFPLHFRDIRVSFFAYNLISAQQNPEIVSAKISKGLAAGRLGQCRINLDCFLSLCAYIGVPMAPEKTVCPENILAFAGIELDTVFKHGSSFTYGQNREMQNTNLNFS